MGFNPSLPRQDENWEIQVAVLLSFLLQVLLIFLGPTRRRSSAIWSRLTLWFCYLLADSVAVLALGLILYNISKREADGMTTANMMIAFWTPFLLLHLGGPDTITAYSLEATSCGSATSSASSSSSSPPPSSSSAPCRATVSSRIRITL
jgi:hypothetical protein